MRSSRVGGRPVERTGWTSDASAVGSSGAGSGLVNQIARAAIASTRVRPAVKARATTADRTPLLELCGGLFQQLARDDEQLDLLRALEDVEDLRVARPLLEQLGLAVPARADQRDAAQADVGRRAARLRLGHRGLQRVRLAVVGHPARLHGQ